MCCCTQRPGRRERHGQQWGLWEARLVDSEQASCVCQPCQSCLQTSQAQSNSDDHQTIPALWDHSISSFTTQHANKQGTASLSRVQTGNYHKNRICFPPVICSSFMGTVPFQELRRWCMHSGLMVCTAALQTRGQVWGTTKACTLPYCPSTTCILMATRLVLSWHLHHQLQSSGKQTRCAVPTAEAPLSWSAEVIGHVVELWLAGTWLQACNECCANMQPFTIKTFTTLAEACSTMVGYPGIDQQIEHQT